jgi:CheY-like chemotaxis protein
LTSYPAKVEVQRLVAEAIKLVEPLVGGKRTVIRADSIGSADLVLADRAILKQVMVQLLACGIQAGAPEVEVLIDASSDASSARIGVRFCGDLPAVERRLADTQRIAASRGIVCQLRSGSAGSFEATLRLQRGNPVSVLVVEDNPGAVELYRRYLSATGWQLHCAADPRTARDIAGDTHPDVIVLDIMMPRLDGWSVLQSLRDSPATADIPVLICSVVEQPELAAALGAQAYLTKPVGQGEFLVALRSCLERRNQPLPEPPPTGG